LNFPKISKNPKKNKDKKKNFGPKIKKKILKKKNFFFWAKFFSWADLSTFWPPNRDFLDFSPVFGRFSTKIQSKSQKSKVDGKTGRQTTNLVIFGHFWSFFFKISATVSEPSSSRF
jgi:hypothetical protein